MFTWYIHISKLENSYNWKDLDCLIGIIILTNEVYPYYYEHIQVLVDNYDINHN